MEKTGNKLVTELFKVGAHFGFVKSRRHPSAKPYLYGRKDNIEIFDLEKTSGALERALAFVREKGKEGALGLLVGGKSEARESVREAGRALSLPYVSGRWIGGILTNFSEIKKRIGRLEELKDQREKGELTKYTKRERLLIDREIQDLETYFGSLSLLKSLPKFLVIIDPKKESIALAEARQLNIPVVALAGSDVNLHELDFAIPGNDASRQTIAFVMDRVTKVYKEGAAERDTKEEK